jgi:hypothetical protein
LECDDVQQAEGEKQRIERGELEYWSVGVPVMKEKESFSSASPHYSTTPSLPEYHSATVTPRFME